MPSLFDPYRLSRPETQQNPYPCYERLRREAPVYFSEVWKGWLLTRHADVLAGFRDARLSSKPRTRGARAMRRPVTTKKTTIRWMVMAGMAVGCGAEPGNETVAVEENITEVRQGATAPWPASGNGLDTHCVSNTWMMWSTSRLHSCTLAANQLRKCSDGNSRYFKSGTAIVFYHDATTGVVEGTLSDGTSYYRWP